MPTLCIGHRGSAACRPENTLASFGEALAAGADGVELDTQVTRDGIPVVFHDPSLRRLTGAAGTVRRSAYRDLRELRVRGEEIPTLAAALKHIGPAGIVQVEIKPGVPVGPVIRAIRASGATDGVVLASFSGDALRAAAELAPGMPRMLIADRPRLRRGRPAALALLREMAKFGASGISVDHRAISSREFVETVHARGAGLWCWTVNAPADMRRLAKWGVDAILSDDPRTLRRIIDSI